MQQEHHTSKADPDLAATLANLYKRPAFGIKFGLETERALLAHLNNPQDKLKVIHVAGSNGKGSVCAMLEAVLRAAGLKTGLYTSPHLIRFNERIRVNGEPISDAALAELITLVDAADQAASAQPNGRAATFFEFATALAFQYFQREQVDIAILETGLGGRLDATNVVTPLLAVICSISLEHTAFLGKDLLSIAQEKAGIIKPARPLIVGPLPQEAQTEIGRLAQQQHAPLIAATQSVSVQRLSQNHQGQKIKIESAANSYGSLTLPLIGKFQIINTAIAIATLEVLANLNAQDLPLAAVRKGLEQVSWPGRFQLISPVPRLIVDGAHNPEAAAALAQALKDFLPATDIGLILGMCADKDLDGFLNPLAGLVKRCWLVPLNNVRGRPPQDLLAATKARGWPSALTNLSQALSESRSWALANAGAVCATGSLFLTGQILARQSANYQQA